MPPDGRQPRRPTDRPGSARPAGRIDDEPDEARLAPREQARIDEAVVTVARRGSGPMLVAVLVAAAFLLGLVRPWDWLAGGPAERPGREAGELPGVLTGATAAPGLPSPGGGVPGAPTPEAGRATAPPRTATCGFPSSWRTSSISFWAGARARIWTAAVAVPATGPGDPVIPFHAIASDTVEALGWCAPVLGPERPPLTAEATLYRLHDGIAVLVAADLLEPADGDALGELWVPRAAALGRPPPWAPGRYVIRLATPSGTYERFLGIDVGVPPRPIATPGAGEPGRPSPGAGGAPGRSTGPAPSPSP